MTTKHIVPLNSPELRDAANPSASQQSAAPGYVVVVGGANLDVMGQSAADLRPADSNPGRVRFAPGGVGRNVAENLARLGVATCLISAVGDDAPGRELLQATAKAGVDVAGVRVVAQARTATYISLYGPEGGLSLAVNDMDVLRHVDAAWLQRQQLLLAQAALWVVDANLGEEALAALFAAAASPAQGQPVIFADAVSSAKAGRLQAYLPRIHTLKLNRQEAAALLGQAVHTTAEALKATQALHQRGGARVVLSLGADGLCWCDADGSTGHLAANPVQVVNSNGAGDALLAGLVLGHMRGQSLPQAARLGLACAEATLQSPLANALVLGAL